MIFYKNTSLTVKTFYGVTFNLGEVNGVPGYINHRDMICVPEPKEPPKAEAATKKSSPVSSSKADTMKSDTEESTTSIKSNNKEKQGGESDGTDNNK